MTSAARIEHWNEAERLAGRSLSEYEAQCYLRLHDHTGRTRHGGGPWERSWVQGATSAEAAAYGRLYRKGLIERDPGGPKVPHRYRLRAEP